MRLMYSLLAQVCCKAEIAMALPPLWTRWLKQKSQWSLEAMVMVVDWMSTELLMQWAFGNAGTIQWPKNCNPCYETWGHCSFFSLSVNERYGTEMKILPTFCQYNRVKPWKFEKLKNFKEKIDFDTYRSSKKKKWKFRRKTRLNKQTNKENFKK